MKSQTGSAPILEPQTLKAIDLYLEEFYPQSKNAGNEMARVDLGTSQIRGLETLVTSTTRFSEIINYIKNQAGKDRHNTWSQIAQLLLNQLEQLETKATQMGYEDPAMILDIKMRLARGWAKQAVTHYLYVTSQRERRG